MEIEVEDLDQAREALDAGAEVLLLDNMGVEEMAAAVKLARGRALTEASVGSPSTMCARWRPPAST